MDSPPPSEPRHLAETAVLIGVPLWKRVLDIACILIASPALVPLGLLVALLIKFVSPGPAFFKQARVGYRGRQFQIWKFRTMAVNVDTRIHEAHLAQLIKSGQPMVKLDAGGDPRLIPFGSWLRSLGIDELPQVLNVLRGEMSLVGPRPCVPYECEKYQPRHHGRFDTLPGLTGLWQVNGKNRTTFEEMMEWDLQYVRDKSLLLDLGILARTIPAIITQVLELKARQPRARRTPLAESTGANRSLHRQP